MLWPPRLFTLVLLLALLRPAIGAETPSDEGRSRSFVLAGSAAVDQVPPDAKRLDVWLPVPASDEFQRISDLVVECPAAHELQTEREYGNRVLHAWTEPAAPLAIKISFRCTRLEQHCSAHSATQPEPPSRLTQADKLGIIDDEVRAMADRITAGRKSTADRARAIYEYVVDHMSYDKEAPGWGRGDTLRACRLAKGNCTDFHSLFISLARAQGIPCRFDIGFQIPSGRHQTPIEGYHCWAEYWSREEGWVPVDASEASKHPDRRAFYLGSLDQNRIRMSTGRDLRLPGMHGEPLNYFVFPYGEVDGKPLDHVRHANTVSDD
jgi:transglutaminase-like putative cysteine protease